MSSCPHEEENKPFYKRFTDSLPSVSSVPRWIWFLLLTVVILYVVYLANEKGYLKKILPGCNTTNYDLTTDSPVRSASRFLPRGVSVHRAY